MKQKEKNIKDKSPIAWLERKLKAHTFWVNSVVVNPDSTWAVSRSWDNTNKTWDMETSQCRVTVEVHKDQIRSVSITPEGTHLFSGSKAEIVWSLPYLKGHNNIRRNFNF